MPVKRPADDLTDRLSFHQDDEAAPGNVLAPLARLLIILAEQGGFEAGELPRHRPAHQAEANGAVAND